MRSETSERGSRKAWIFLRGLVREKGHWGTFLDRFRLAFPEDEILPIDLPGAGEFRRVTCPRRMDEVFQFVRGVAIERATVGLRFDIVAISMGAMVALEWMRQRPDELSSCVLMNTSLKSLSPMHHRLRWQIWKQFLRIITLPSPREREQAIIEILMNSQEARQKAMPLWVHIATEHPVTYLNFVNQLVAAARFHGLDEKPLVPVMLLSGLGDRLTDPSCSEALHKKWGWPLYRHAWAGHDLPWDDSAWVIERIQSWHNAKDAWQQQIEVAR